jgi:hypothetical protein
MFHMPLSIMIILTLDTQVFIMMAMLKLTFIRWFMLGSSTLGLLDPEHKGK